VDEGQRHCDSARATVAEPFDSGRIISSDAVHCAWTRKQIPDCHLYLAAPRIHVAGKSNLLSRFTRNEFNLEVRFLTGGDCEARTPDPQMPEWDSRCNAVQRPDCAPLTDGVLRSIALGLACSVPCSPNRRSALSSRRSRFSRMAKPSRRRSGTRQDRSDTERSRRRQSNEDDMQLQHAGSR